MQKLSEKLSRWGGRRSPRLGPLLSRPVCKGVRKGGVLWLKTTLELDILQKLYYLRKRRFFRLLLLVICRLNANTAE